MAHFAGPRFSSQHPHRWRSGVWSVQSYTYHQAKHLYVLTTKKCVSVQDHEDLAGTDASTSRESPEYPENKGHAFNLQWPNESLAVSTGLGEHRSNKQCCPVPISSQASSWEISEDRLVASLTWRQIIQSKPTLEWPSSSLLHYWGEASSDWGLKCHFTALFLCYQSDREEGN